MIKAYAAFEPKCELKPFEFDPGELKTNEVEINVLHCGICHSDLSMLDNEWNNSKYPLVMGHEVVGEITQLGSDVTHLQIGQNVGLGWQSGSCQVCSSCNNGDENLCEQIEFTIIDHHGGFADKVRAKASSVMPIPDGIDLESAGPLFCAGLTVFNPLVQFDIKPTAKVAVIGIGGLGHLALQFLNAWGCEVTAFTSSESKTVEAKEMGAHNTLNSRDKDDISAAANSFDLIISTVSANLDWNLYLTTLRPRGRLHMVGAMLEPLGIKSSLLMKGQRSVSSSPVGSVETAAKMLEFSKLHNIRPLIEVYPFEKINEAMDRLRSGKARYRIVLSK